MLGAWTSRWGCTGREWAGIVSVALTLLAGCGSSGDGLSVFGAGGSHPDGGPAGSGGTANASGGGANTGGIGDGGSPSSGSCVSDAACRVTGQLCDRSRAICVDCLADAHCGAGKQCLSGSCIAEVPCTNSLICASLPDRQICDRSAGRCVQCSAAADCGASNDCVGGVCVPYVSCKSSLDCPMNAVCDKVRGRCGACVADADCSTDEACVAGSCAKKCQSDTACTPLGLLCDKTAGHCVQCVEATDCTAPLLCAAGACVACVPSTCPVGACGQRDDGCGTSLDCGACPTNCSDGVLDGSETSIDCGGATCPACAATCSDGTKNGTETDVDCGGRTCAPCKIGSACSSTTDCLNSVCTAGICRAPVSCTPTASPAEVCDGVDNDCDGTIDNAGVCPAGCSGLAFQGGSYVLCTTARTWPLAEADCATRGMHLVRIETSQENEWLKQALNGKSMTAAWIGGDDRAVEGVWRWLGGTQFWAGSKGGSPVQFSDWRAASMEPNDARPDATEDCLELQPDGWNDEACTEAHGYVCERYAVPSGCYDGAKNGTELDVDCGGSCGTCPAGSHCNAGTDCETASCVSSICASTCGNSVKDGKETDVDCGGICAACGAGKSCIASDDCTSACVSGKCTGCVNAATDCPGLTCTLTPPFGGGKCCTAGKCGCITFEVCQAQ